MRIEIINLQKKISIQPQRIIKTLLRVLRYEGKSLSLGLNIVFVTNQKITYLNKRFLKKNEPTDVLVFNLGNEADIVISCDMVIRQARDFGTSVQYELYLYLVHGLLHILGYDDKTERQRKIMTKRASRIMRRLIRYVYS